MLEIDGSSGEGGGQILRTALALSAITGKAFHLHNIRKGRCEPGLASQHLHTIHAIKELCQAEVSGAELGSCEITFTPKTITGRTISIDVETAGSITLLLQSALLASIFSEKKVRWKLKGGTDVRWSMPFDYMRFVLLPHLVNYADIEVSLERRGYYPAGGGVADIIIRPFRKSQPMEKISRGELMIIKGLSHASKALMGAEVAERQARSARLELASLGCPIKIDTEYSDSLSPGSGITLWATFAPKKAGDTQDDEIDLSSQMIIGADALGEKGKRAEAVGKEAADSLKSRISQSAPIDENLADNLIPYLALFGGSIMTSRITEHCRTNISICQMFLDAEFWIDETKCTISAKIEAIKKDACANSPSEL